MEGVLKGKTAIVTGATAGIGKEIALTFAKQGAKVAVFGTSSERGQEVVEAIKAQGGEGVFIAVDISKTDAVETSVQQAVEKLGHVDILVNNAGITKDQLMLKMTEEDWDSVIDINLKSCYNTCKALMRAMLKARQGKIINISSVVGLTGNAGQVNYASSKAGMIGFTKALAQEVAKRGITVNCIAPGFIETRMTDAMNEEQRKSVLEKIPMGRMGSTKDIAHAALFLASPFADYITGQVITVDGGMVM